MLINQDCPLDSKLPTIESVTCSQQFGQIQKLAIRLTPTEPEDDIFSDVEELLKKSNWEALIEADDETKLVFTPNIPGIVIPNSEELKEEGGNNNTIDGISMPVGKGTVKVTGKMLNLPVKIAKQLESLSKFSNVGGTTLIEAFLLNEAGQIIYKLDGERAIGFPIYNLFVSSVGTEGLNKPNSHVVSFEMPGDWDNGLEVASPLKLEDDAWDPRKLALGLTLPEESQS